MLRRRSKSSSNPSRADLQTGLSKIPLLRVLSSGDRRRILHELEEAHYGKDEFIFREGDPAEYFHIVKEGTVKCVKSSSQGRECTLKMLMPGDLFCCDAAVFDGACHPGTAKPMGDVSVLRIKKQAYYDMLRRNPDAAIEVIKYLGNRLNEAQEKTKILALDRADQRLAALLVDMAKKSGVKDRHGIRLAVRVTREDMANMVGTSTETAIRIMGRFKRDQLVVGTANRLVIRNLDRLTSLAYA